MSIGIIRNLGNSAGGGTKVPSPLIPVMTSNTTPSGYVASASTEYNTGWMAYKAFDGRSDTCWTSTYGHIADEKLTIKFPSAKCVKFLRVTNVSTSSDTQFPMASFYFEGSNDGTTFFTIGSYTTNSATGAKTLFEINNSTSYLYYRIRVISKHGTSSGQYVSVGDVQMYDANPLEPKFLYKDGKQNVPWDNAGNYAFTGGYIADGGFNLENAYMQPNSVSYNHHRVIISDGVIDLSEYSTLKVQYNNNQTLTLNIANVQASVYVALAVYADGSGMKFYIGISNVKNNFYNASISTQTGYVSTSPVINRVWLEK